MDYVSAVTEFCQREGVTFHEYPDLERPFKKEEYAVVTLQFTGLLDKNGVEIYEGDIVARNPRIIKNVPAHGDLDTAEVVEVKEIYGSDDMGIDCIGYPMYWRDMEVIGNIYQNPELLEAK